MTERTLLSLSDFDGPSLAKIATSCDIEMGQIQDIYQCTPFQMGSIADSAKRDDSHLISITFSLGPSIQRDRLCATIRQVVALNAILRTRIVNSKFGLVQVIVEENHHTLFDMTHLDQLKRYPMSLGTPLFWSVVQDNKFVLLIHHAAMDQASLIALLQDIKTIYQGGKCHVRSPFRSFVEHCLKVDELEARSFWKSQFEECATEFPTPVPGHIASPVSSLHREVSFANSQGKLSLSLVPVYVEAAWALTASVYHGSLVSYGFVLSGRPNLGAISNTLGPTISTVPIHVKIRPDMTIQQFLRSRARLRREMSTSAALHYGLSKITAISESTRRGTSFQTLLNIRPNIAYSTNFGDMNFESLSVGQGTYPLVLNLTLEENTLLLEAAFDASVISMPQTKELVEQFDHIFRLLVKSDPTNCITDLTFIEKSPIWKFPTQETDTSSLTKTISPNQHKPIFASSQFASEMVRTGKWHIKTPKSEMICYLDLFDRIVEVSPHSEAVCCEKQSLTYSDVDDYSTRLAHNLVTRGMLSQAVIAVCFEKSIWTIVAILAIFKAGCVYLPIDPTHPRTRNAEVIEAAQVAAALVLPMSVNILVGLCDLIIVVDHNSLREESRTYDLAWRHKNKPSDAAYILFTSGSTGRPKGFIIDHSAICTSILHHGPALGLDQKPRVLQFCAHTFDVSIAEFLTTLAFGGCICVPSEYNRLYDLAGTITRLKVDTLLAVPTVANVFEPNNVPTLKRIVLGGEPVSTQTFQRWADHVELVAAYGPSECSVYSAASVSVSNSSDPSHIGKSIGCSQWIVDPDYYIREIPIGEIGELVIYGPILARGYLENGSVDNDAFAPVPAWLRNCQTPGTFDRIYKTGDLAAFNQDGTLKIIGRKDNQVKLRGHRIELDEIACRLMEHGVAKVVIVCLPKAGLLKQQIVAMVALGNLQLNGIHSAQTIVPLPQDSHVQTINSLIDHARSVLPSYMIPSTWVPVETIPLLPSGKVNRRLVEFWLAEMSYEMLTSLKNGNQAQESVYDENFLALRSILGDTLDVPVKDIRPTCTFLALGGDSISAVRVMACGREKGLDIPLELILSQLSLQRVAESIHKLNKLNKEVAANDIQQWKEIRARFQKDISAILAMNPDAILEDAYPLTPLQRQIWEERQEEPRVFLLLWTMEFFDLENRKISILDIAKAWQAVVRKHPIFRTAFLKLSAYSAQESLQVVLDNIEPVVKVSFMDGDDPVPSLDDVLPPVDLCLLPHRAHFYQRGERLHAQIEFDHKLMDGWSFSLIKKEILVQLSSPRENTSQSFAPFSSFVASQTEARIETDHRYWAKILKTIPKCLLNISPTVLQRQRSPTTLRTVIRLNSYHAASLAGPCAKHHITPATFFYAAWAQMLSLYTSSPNISFEYVFWGREEDKVAAVLDIIGPCLNIFPFHLMNIDHKLEVGSFVALAQMIQAQKVQDTKFTSVNPREILQEDRTKEELPFNTAVNFQRRPAALVHAGWKVQDVLEQFSDPWHVSYSLHPEQIAHQLT